MLKQGIIFEGTVGDDINSAIPLVINKAKEVNSDVFLTWNEVTMRIAPDSTAHEVFANYNRGLHLLSLEVQEDTGELINKKAKHYDEAIKYAHYLINERCKEDTDGSFHRVDLQKMFLELKESKDEKIIKCIKDLIKENTFSNIYGVTKDDCLAWIEKQGEHNPAIWSKEDEIGFNDALYAINQARTIAKDENDMGNLWFAENWLMSFKDRVSNFNNGYKVGFSVAKHNQWKPSDEQMKALKEAVDEHFDIDGGALWHLYEDLKKLKE